MRQVHPGQAILDEQQQLNRWSRQACLEACVRAAALEQELRAIRAARRAQEVGQC